MNYTNPGAVSHNEILQMYKDFIDPEFKWSNFSVEEQAKVIVAARSNNLLDTKRVRHVCGYSLDANVKEECLPWMTEQCVLSVMSVSDMSVFDLSCGVDSPNKTAACQASVPSLPWLTWKFCCRLRRSFHRYCPFMTP